MIDFRKVMTKTVIYGVTYYHALALGINLVLYNAGLRNDVKAGDVWITHTLAVYDVLVRAYGQDEVNKVLHQKLNQK